jgi:hypothetical protein
MVRRASDSRFWDRALGSLLVQCPLMPAVLRPRQQAKLARGDTDEEHVSSCPASSRAAPSIRANHNFREALACVQRVGAWDRRPAAADVFRD